MKKFWKITTIVTVLVAVVALAGATAAFAQGPNQPDGVTPPGRNQGQNGTAPGLGLRAVDEEAMHAAIAGALGITVDEFEAAIAEGKTLYTLAEELGIDFAGVQAAMATAHEAALQQAVEDGLITQEQADWMASRVARGNTANGRGRGAAAGAMGQMGRGAGNFGGGFNGECIYDAS